MKRFLEGAALSRKGAIMASRLTDILLKRRTDGASRPPDGDVNSEQVLG